MTSVRRFTFTSFEDAPPAWDENVMKYLVYGAEICPETEKKHWQGYCELNNKTRFETLKKYCPKIHIEVARGSGAQNRTYCVKEGKFSEFGHMGQPGERNDLKKLVTEIEEGARVDDIANEHPVQFLKYHKGVRELVSIKQKDAAKKDRKVSVFVYWGDSGVGKTRRCVETAGHDYYISTAGVPWYDGYAGEETLIIDEMDENAIPYRTLLRLLDRYPVQVPYKGGMVWAQWTRVFITSNICPLKWYPGEDFQPLKRRIYKIEHMTRIGGVRPHGEAVGSSDPQEEPRRVIDVPDVPDVPEVEDPRIYDNNSDEIPISATPVPEVGGNTNPNLIPQRPILITSDKFGRIWIGQKQ